MIEIHVREKTGPCPRCRGKGTEIYNYDDGQPNYVTEPCPDCNGQGYQVQDRWIPIDELQRLLAGVGVDEMFPLPTKEG